MSARLIGVLAAMVALLAAGRATGTHLHFELHRGAVFLNPIYYVSA